MRILLSSIILMFLSSFTGLYAESFEDVKDSIVIIDTETGRRCAILVKMDGILYILTSQDALTGGIVSIKTLSGKILQAQSCEVPEEQIGLLRMKTDFPEAKDVTINGSSKNSGVEVFKTDLKMGIIIEQQTGIEKNNALKFPDENGAPVTFIEEAVGSPVVNKKDNKVLGVVGARGFAVQNCGFAWTEMNKDLVGRKNELQILKQDMKWSKADLTQLIKQGSLIDEAEAFLYPFTVLADFWCNNPYASIVIKPEQPERMKPWIETQNLMVKEIPTIRFKIQEGSKLMGDTMKNVSSGQLKDKSKIIGKRLTDFAPVYQKTLASPNIKWESSYFKKKAEDLSTVFKNLAEGLRKEAEDNTKVNPPL